MLHALALVDALLCHIVPSSRHYSVVRLAFWFETVTLLADAWILANVLVWHILLPLDLLTTSQLATGTTITYVMLLFVLSFMIFIRFSVWAALFIMTSVLSSPALRPKPAIESRWSDVVEQVGIIQSVGGVILPGVFVFLTVFATSGYTVGFSYSD